MCASFGQAADQLAVQLAQLNAYLHSNELNLDWTEICSNIALTNSEFANFHFLL